MNVMNNVHFRQPRRYLENFLDKFLLYMIADKLKIGIFSPVPQTVAIYACLFVPKHPISARNAFMLIVNSQVTQMHPIFISGVIKTQEITPNMRNLLKCVNFEDFWDNLR